MNPLPKEQLSRRIQEQQSSADVSRTSMRQEVTPTSPAIEEMQPTVPQQEQLASPEYGTEQEQDEPGRLDKTIEGLTKRLKKSKKKQIPTIPQVRDEITRQVETILEDGLKDAFKTLTPVQQQEFKIKGEDVAFQIRQLLQGTHIRVRKIFLLIFEWLKLLPGINRFFLQQEAKIKVDKIVALHERYKGGYNKK